MIDENSASSSEYDVSMRQRTLRQFGLDLAAHLDAGAIGQAHVEDGDVRFELADEAHALRGRPRLAHDLEIALRLEQRAQPGPDELMIVEHEHPYPHPVDCATLLDRRSALPTASRRLRSVVSGTAPPIAWSVVQPFDQIDDPVKLRRLVQAILILDAELNLPVVLRRIIEEACDLVDAQYGALGVLSADGQTLDQFLTVGLDNEQEHAIGPRPTGRGVLGTLIADDKPLRLGNLSDSPDSFGTPQYHPAMTSFLGVPVRVHGEVYGNLYLTNKRDAKEFSADDEELVLALAMAAGIAIENARLHSMVREHALTEDRDRIARDLHDSVIQRLFAIGLSLQGTTRLVERPEAVLRIAEAIDKLDETIRQLRKAIFDIELTINKEGLHPKVLDLLHELRPVLDILPRWLSAARSIIGLGPAGRGGAGRLPRGAHQRRQARPGESR